MILEVVKNKKYFLYCICSLLLLTSCGRKHPAPVRQGNKQTRYKATSTKPVEKRKKGEPAKVVYNNGHYVVRKGDTTYSISKKYNISLRSIIEKNGLKPPYKLHVGQRLQIPKAQYHIVKKGDTTYSIARENGVSLSTLLSLNNKKAPYKIRIGEKLALPYGHVAKQNISKPKVKTKPKISQIKESSIPRLASGKFLKPVDGPIISSFGSKSSGLQNDGINIKAPKGTSVKAAENGVVVYASDKIKGLGNIVLIKHDNGWVTAYGHLNDIFVNKGQTVSKATKIATVGDTGSVNTPQLHFEIRKNTKPVNPAKYLK